MRGISKKALLTQTALTIVCICVWAHGANAAPIIAAYQEIYRMNFEVLQQAGLPAGWYVTSDGYPVAQVSPNHWVYGHSAHSGTLVPTDVAVGAVVPMDEPQLARVAVLSWHGGAYDTKQFRSIAPSKLDNMGVLNDPLAYTPIAWKSASAELQIWLGDRWHRIVPAVGQSTSQALMAQHSYIVQTLNRKNASWTVYDTQELADLAREWGYLWHGDVYFASLHEYRDSNSPDRYMTTGKRGVLPGKNPDGREWDIGRGSGNVRGNGGVSGGDWE